MKTLMCSLAAILSVVLGSGTAAAVEDGRPENISALQAGKNEVAPVPCGQRSNFCAPITTRKNPG
jgi:hypothetical protein